MKEINLKAIGKYLTFGLLMLTTTLILSPSLFAHEKEITEIRMNRQEFYEIKKASQSGNKTEVLKDCEQLLLKNPINNSNNFNGAQLRSLGDTIAETFPDPIMT